MTRNAILCTGKRDFHNPRHGISRCLVLTCSLATLFFCTSRALCDPAQQAPRPGTFEGKTVDQWLSVLKDTELDGETRRRAAYALGRIQPPATKAVPALVEALDDNYLDLCWYGVDALGRIGPDAAGAVPDIIRAIEKSKNYTFQRNGIIALGRIGPKSQAQSPKTISLLSRVTKSTDETLRTDSALALWRVDTTNPKRDEQAVALLLEVLKNGKGDGPYRACRALREIGPGSELAAKPLILALRHENPDVRAAAADVLSQMDLAAAVLLATAAPKMANLDEIAAASVWGGILEGIRTDVIEGTIDDKEEYTLILEKLKTRVLPELVRRLGSNDASIRRAYSQALARAGIVGMGPLALALDSDDPSVRSSAAEALELMERYLPTADTETPHEGFALLKTAALSGLMAAMKSQYPPSCAAGVRMFEALAFGPEGAVATPLLRTALKDEDPSVRRRAMRALNRLKE